MLLGLVESGPSIAGDQELTRFSQEGGDQEARRSAGGRRSGGPKKGPAGERRSGGFEVSFS
jgi:hypothetical protein